MGVGKFGILGLLVLSVFLFGCTSSGQFQTQNMSGRDGRVVFAMKDAAANMGAVTSVVITVDSVSVHSASEGWITLSSTPRTYDLLALKAQGSTVLLADANVSEGTYEQMRLSISRVMVTDANGTHEAKLPSGELKIVGQMVVTANSTSTATFDFIADDSLHLTGTGQYILAPVVQLETRDNATAEVRSDNRVEISGGRVRTNVLVGMGADGLVRVNARIPADINLTIENGHVVVVGTGSGGVGVGIGAGSSAEGNAGGMGQANGNANASASVSGGYS